MSVLMTLYVYFRRQLTYNLTLNSLPSWLFLFLFSCKKEIALIEVDIKTRSWQTETFSTQLSESKVHAKGIHNTSWPAWFAASSRLETKTNRTWICVCKWTVSVSYPVRLQCERNTRKELSCEFFFGSEFEIFGSRENVIQRKWQHTFHELVMTSKAWCYFSQYASI